MSFWGGMARGFKDASEKKERDQAVERQQERLYRGCSLSVRDGTC